MFDANTDYSLNLHDLDLDETSFATHGRVTGLNANGPFTSNGYFLFCGACFQPAHHHPLIDADYPCLRMPNDIGAYAESGADFYGYYRPSSTTKYPEVIPCEIPADYSGSPARDFNVSSSETYDACYDGSWADELDAIDNWRDQDPEVGTHAIAYWHRSPSGVRTSGTYAVDHPNRKPRDYDSNPSTRNAFVEGNDAFLSIQLLSEELTDKYHKRLLNQFINKQGKVQVGSIQFATRSDGTRVISCVNRKCSRKDANGNWGQHEWTIPTTEDRTVMEAFVLGVIRHGNNHAAAWFTNRPQFYKVHDAACDLKCNQADAHCNANRQVSLTLTDETLVPFLMEHQVHCKNRNCKCDEVLAHEVPALAHA